MRTLLILVTLISSLLVDAQSSQQSLEDSSFYVQHLQRKKWFLTSYSNIGIGLSFFNGRTATVVSAPVGLQLNHELNNNLYAFAGASLEPTYVNFNHSFPTPGRKTATPNGFKSDYFGVYPSVNVGLMYVNDARTFSVSGSIGVSRSSYPLTPYPPIHMPGVNTFSPTPVYR